MKNFDSQSRDHHKYRLAQQYFTVGGSENKNKYFTNGASARVHSPKVDLWSDFKIYDHMDKEEQSMEINNTIQQLIQE